MILLAILLMLGSAPAEANCNLLLQIFGEHHGLREPMDSWGESHARLAKSRIQEKFKPSAGKIAGASQAAPKDPRGEYIDLWIRDNGICVKEVSDNPQIVHDYLKFSYKNYETKTLGGLGEPKYRPDGSAFNEGWGRPQNDGPAYRGLRTFEEIDREIAAGKKVQDIPYYQVDLEKPSVKWDLEYMAHHWRDKSFELWEEEEGLHLHTMAMIQNALEKGSKIAARFEAGGLKSAAAIEYKEEANAIREYLLKNSWDPEKKYLHSVLEHTGGFVEKKERLDISVILTALHTSETAGVRPVFRVTDDRVMATMKKLEERFNEAYHFNERFQGKAYRGAVAMGRYPEDVYHGGNPWVISIHGGAEYYYKFASEVLKDPTMKITELNRDFYARLLQKPREQLVVGTQIARSPTLQKEIAQAAKEKGDAYLEIVHSVTPANGYHAEQIGRGYRPGEQFPWTEQYLKQTAEIGDASVERKGGEWIGAVDLTWNDASYLSAWRARKKLLEQMK